MMVVTHGLKIPEKLSPLSHQRKSRYMIHAPLSLLYLLVACVQCGHRCLSSWDWLPLKAQVERKMQEEGWNRGQGHKAVERWEFCCSPWGSQVKGLKHRPSLDFTSFVGVQMSVRSESLLLMWQWQYRPSANAGQKIHLRLQHVLLKD